jgi:hypothetical protein
VVNLADDDRWLMTVVFALPLAIGVGFLLRERLSDLNPRSSKLALKWGAFVVRSGVR